MKNLTLLILILISFNNFGQITLKANGSGNTYEDITAVLAPGNNPVEVPDCNHASFGRHIDEVYDTTLRTNVFRFMVHVTPDNDRCKTFDRQRNEIKTYSKSPENLKGVYGEKVVYKWKFKLDANFQPSTSFTHIHQLKSVGGSLASMPMYTLTLRKGNPDKLELRYAATNSQITLKQADLAPFKGEWLEVTEQIEYSNSGYYSIQIKKISDNSVLFEYSGTNIHWRSGATFVRPKWGIYRSLNNSQYLRDEELFFNDFSIEEVSVLSTKKEALNDTVFIYPNPANKTIRITETTKKIFNSIQIVNSLGQVIISKKDKKSIDISELSSGIYAVFFLKDNQKIDTKKLVIE